jgi:hypothetical protein
MALNSTSGSYSTEKRVIKRFYPWILVAMLFAVLVSLVSLFRPRNVEAQQYPIMDKVADKIIMKYEQSSCEQLQQKQQQKAPPSPGEVKAVQFLHSDPQMRAAFISKVAPPIANKLFDCGMIP